MQLTKDQIAQSAIKELKANGARVRKVHNVPVNKNRRNHIEKGWPDIQGYSRNAVYMGGEVKTINDKLSAEQIERLKDIDHCGGIAFVATQVGNQVELIPWKQYSLEKLITNPISK